MRLGHRLICEYILQIFSVDKKNNGNLPRACM